MPDYRRPKATGATIFFTVNLADREVSLLTDHIAKLRASVAETRAEHPFAIDAWVVLPDHMHCVWTLPKRDRAYGQRWGAIKSRFTRKLRKVGALSRHDIRAAMARSGNAGVWQPRFWEHHIRDANEYRFYREYCWMNPVKHGFVQNPNDWEYSSVHRDCPQQVRARAG